MGALQVPVTLLESFSPYGSRKVTVEYDGVVTAAYLHDDTSAISAIAKKPFNRISKKMIERCSHNIAAPWAPRAQRHLILSPLIRPSTKPLTQFVDPRFKPGGGE